MIQKAIFRKIAPHLWTEASDPSVYGFFELDVTGISSKKDILPFFLYSLNQTMLKHPELTSFVRFGKVRQRAEKTISVMVNINEAKKDLSALSIVIKPQLNIDEIRDYIQVKSNQVREKKDPHLGPALKLLSFLPSTLAKIFLKIYSTLIYEFDTRLGIRSLPKTPFGSVIVSNIGSLGLTKALLPLVPLARPAMMLSVGKAVQEAKVVNNEICIRDVVHVGATFDHRLFDGSHAAEMLETLEAEFAKLFKNDP